MTILDRDTLIDRPEIVTREDDEDEDNEDDETENQDAGETQVLGDGGGVELNGVEFETDDLDVVAAANTCAVLTTGQQEGEVFEQMFRNAAVQLKDMKQRNRDVEMLSYFGLNNAIGTIGLSDQKRNQAMNQVIQSDNSDGVGEDSTQDNGEDSDEDNEIDIDEVEEEVDDIKESRGDDEDNAAEVSQEDG